MPIHIEWSITYVENPENFRGTTFVGILAIRNHGQHLDIFKGTSKKKPCITFPLANSHSIRENFEGYSSRPDLTFLIQWKPKTGKPFIRIVIIANTTEDKEAIVSTIKRSSNKFQSGQTKYHCGRWIKGTTFNREISHYNCCWSTDMDNAGCLSTLARGSAWQYNDFGGSSNQTRINKYKSMPDLRSKLQTTEFQLDSGEDVTNVLYSTESTLRMDADSDNISKNKSLQEDAITSAEILSPCTAKNTSSRTCRSAAKASDGLKEMIQKETPAKEYPSINGERSVQERRVKERSVFDKPNKKHLTSTSYCVSSVIEGETPTMMKNYQEIATENSFIEFPSKPSKQPKRTKDKKITSSNLKTRRTIFDNFDSAESDSEFSPLCGERKDRPKVKDINQCSKRLSKSLPDLTASHKRYKKIIEDINYEMPAENEAQTLPKRLTKYPRDISTKQEKLPDSKNCLDSELNLIGNGNKMTSNGDKLTTRSNESEVTEKLTEPKLSSNRRMLNSTQQADEEKASILEASKNVEGAHKISRNKQPNKTVTAASSLQDTRFGCGECRMLETDEEGAENSNTSTDLKEGEAARMPYKGCIRRNSYKACTFNMNVDSGHNSICGSSNSLSNLSQSWQPSSSAESPNLFTEGVGEIFSESLRQNYSPCDNTKIVTAEEYY